MNSSNLTPMMKQYMEAKNQYPEAILFFRLGDFYEMFFKDAQIAAPILDIALTSRSRKGDNQIPMCGIPFKSAEIYIRRLIDQGYKVAICEQVENPALAKGLVARKVTELITPGMVLSETGQTSKAARFLVAITSDHKQKPKIFALAGLEVSTGDFWLSQFESDEALKNELMAMSPHEVVICDQENDYLEKILGAWGFFLTTLPQEKFKHSNAWENLKSYFNPQQLTGWNIAEQPLVIMAAGAVLNYAETSCGGSLKYLESPKIINQKDILGLDDVALRNLEILKPLSADGLDSSLLAYLNRTSTPMGARLLRNWLVRPLKEKKQIVLRHQCIEFWLINSINRDQLKNILKSILDIERSLSRLVLSKGSPRDLAAVLKTLSVLPEIKETLKATSADKLQELGSLLDTLPKLYALLEQALIIPLPLNFKDGNLIKTGFNEELDKYLALEKGAKEQLAALESIEKKRTGINSLKIAYNRVFGYFLEVTKSNLNLVPNEWQRKQTIANGERYITLELKKLEEEIITASEKKLILEEEIITYLGEEVAKKAPELKKAAQIIAECDVLIAFSEIAEKYHFTKPLITEEPIIDIIAGRHPVVEKFLPPGENFVANDIYLSPQENILIITGPNMAGKSTILRLTALIVLLNQIGSFVPAQKATLSLRDHIFTRVGASDDLARGRSTFMVEMNETAHILQKATPQSLIILDEVGRGTSTFDGLSIAWAVVEYLHDLENVGVPTLFATHYHELVALAESKAAVKNYNVTVKSWQGEIIFLRKLSPGGVSRSHGLAVAKLAGIPKKVLKRAQEILMILENSENHLGIISHSPQLDLFKNQSLANFDEYKPTIHPLVERIKTININNLTPLEGLKVLSEIIDKAKNEN